MLFVRDVEAEFVEEILQGQAGSEVAELPAAGEHRGVAAQVALLADGLRQVA